MLKKITKKIFSELPINLIKNGAILIIIFLIYGVLGSYFIMGLTFFDSVYYTVTTMATVGFGDIIPQTTIQKLFSMTVALSGVGILAYVFTGFIQNLSERATSYSEGIRMYKKIDKMKNYYILCGYGRVGTVVFEKLKKRNQNVIIIEKDPDATANIEIDEKTVIINTDATESEILKKIANEKCSSLIITTSSDVTNLFIVLTARELDPDAWIVTRCSKTENIKRLYNAGASKVISPEIIGGGDIYFEAAKPHILRVTLQHRIDEIKNEMYTVLDYDCIIENIDYHFPGIKSPLTRTIGVVSKEEIDEFIDKLEKNPQSKNYLENLYSSVHYIHSHWISGSDKECLNRLLEYIEKDSKVLGINLTNEEIAELTKKYVD